MAIERTFSESDWLATLNPVRRYVESLEQLVERLATTVAQLIKRIERFEKLATLAILGFRRISGSSDECVLLIEKRGHTCSYRESQRQPLFR